MTGSPIITEPHLGTDEAGKGDYFGPLTVAGVFADELALTRLPQVGVRDAKKLAVSSLWRLEKAVKQICPQFEVVRILPARYNELHTDMRNLNRLLAWAHARVIENLLERTECDLAVADKFGDESYIEQALMKRGKRIRLIQRVRAEDDPAVAAASILARAAFIRSLEQLSQVAGLTLPRGATHVLPSARQVFKKGGQALLSQVAKLHFKTTKQVVARNPDEGVTE